MQCAPSHWSSFSSLASILGLSACAAISTAAPGPDEGLQIHFSDCQAGAAPDCVPGSNTNPGTSTRPKQTIAGINLSTLPAGTTLRFRRGGSWDWRQQIIVNPNSSASRPLTLADYGSGPLPILRVASGTGLQFARWNDSRNDGGYVVRNLKLDGLGSAQWGVFAGDNVHDLLFDGIEITGFVIGLNVESSGSPGTVGLTMRNSHLHRNREMGVLGKAHRAVYENNLFENNNPSGSNRFHAMYLSGGNDIVVKNNRFLRNSVTSAGSCDGGNVTVHGQVNGLLIEGNLIEQDLANGGCYGFSITPGYLHAEWFRNVVVRRNTVVNVGNCAICAGAAPGIVVEENKLINLRPTFQVGVHIPVGVRSDSPVSAGDDADTGAVVQGNTVCQSQPARGSVAVIAAVPQARVAGNVYRVGAEALTGPCAR